MKSFVEHIRELHEMLKDPIDSCIIVCCSNKATMAVKGNDSGKIYYACDRCAFELVESNTHTLVTTK